MTVAAKHPRKWLYWAALGGLFVLSFLVLREADAGIDPEEQDFVIELFSRVQAKSIASNRELCGYLGYDETGSLVATKIALGSEASCTLPHDDGAFDIIASYHTHSSYSVDYDSELPSALDMESDRDSGINGWVATPGGRLWYIDSFAMEAIMVCGVGCLPMDKNFVRDTTNPVKKRYRYHELLAREKQE